MENKYSHTLVGIFVIGFLLLFMALSVWLTSSHEDVETVPYRLITQESVTGVSPNSVVDYQGVDVGKVRHISLDANDPRNVIIELEINKGTPIKVDTTAYLIGKGITGLVGISLTGGTPNSEPLTPTEYDPIPTIRTGPSLTKRIDTAIDSITIALTDLSDHLNNVLTPENIDSISQILTNIEKVTEDFSNTTPDIRLIVNNASDIVTQVKPKIEAAAESLSKLSPIMDKLKNSSEDLDKFANSLAEIPDHANMTLKKWGRLADTSNDEIRAIMPEINNILTNFSALIEQINEKPNALIMGKKRQRRGPGE